MARPRTRSEIAQNLEQLARGLEALSHLRSLPPAEKHLCMRYAPFLAELSRRPAFCDRLLHIPIRGEMTIPEARSLMLPVIRDCRLPDARPYDDTEWANLLIRVRLGHVEDAPPPGPFLWRIIGERFEVQFVYGGTIKQVEETPHKVPVAQVVQPQIRRGLSEVQAKKALRTALRQPLARFLRRIRPLVKESLWPSFDVRAVLFHSRPGREEPVPGRPEQLRIYFTNPLYDESIPVNFSVRLPPRRRIDPVLRGIVDKLSPVLRDILHYTPSRGRPPDMADDARWWAMRALDGMSVEEIAKRETGDDPNAADLEETISKALRRLRMTSRTE